MAKKSLSVLVSKSKLESFWVSVDDLDVDVINGTGSVQLDSGPHVLVWWMLGEAGGSVGIELSDAGRVVAKVKESKVPSGEMMGAGTLRFEV